MRLLICAGGTGGGVYPALAVLEALGHEAEPVLWVGSQGGMEAALVKHAAPGIRFEAIAAAGLHGVGWRVMPRNIIQLGKGVFESRRLLYEFKPDIIFFTGGFVAAPMALAGRGVSSLLYVPDIEPGLALKFLARFSSRIAVTNDDSRKYFSHGKNITVTGYPVRSNLRNWTPESARAHFRLNSQVQVLLIFGGSKGARSINQAVTACLSQILAITQVIHITGQADWSEAETVQARLPIELSTRYHAFPYLYEDMGAALACADLSISRAGASCLGELPLFGTPAILVPYPYAWRYQKVNADYMRRQNAAVVLDDSGLKEHLFSTIKDLLDQPIRLKSMSSAMHDLAHPKAANQIAGLLRELAVLGGTKW